MSCDQDPSLPLRTIVIPSVLGRAKEPEDLILRAAQKHGFNEESIFAIKLTLEEALTNAIKHGNQCDASKNVTIRYHVDDRQVVIYIKDQGPGFNCDAVPDPTTPDRLPLPNGRGILLMRAYMTDLEYREKGTEVYMRKLKEE